MKSKPRLPLLLAAGSIFLPLGLFAQAGIPSDQRNRPDQQQNPAWQSGQQFLRVSEAQMDTRITADQLKGKKVVDRNGQKIGKIKHIGLTQALGQADQSLSETSRSGGAGSSSVNPDSRSSMQSTGASTRSPTTTASAGSRPTGSSTSTSASSTGSGSSLPSSPSMSSPGSIVPTLSSSSMNGGGQARLLVELDNDVAGANDDLIEIPISQARFDKEKGEVKLQVSRQDLVAQIR